MVTAVMKGDVLLQAVTEVARRAGKVALSHFRSRLSIETKGDGSPVTVADRAAEQAAREWIEKRFPDDGILGEEFGATNPGARRQWIVDPIDGTKSFVRGVPLWGTLIALVEASTVLAGAAFCPAADELIGAAPGLGCWWNGARCTVSGIADLGKATVLTTSERFKSNPDRHDRWAKLAAQAAVSRTWGDCFGYLLVASGRAEVMSDDRVSAWDIAPFIPIIAEAGGVLTDFRGRPIRVDGDFRTAVGDAIATNAHLAAATREMLLDPTA